MKIEMKHSDFHNVVVSHLRNELTEALRSLFNEGFSIEIISDDSSAGIIEHIKTKKQFDTWFGE